MKQTFFFSQPIAASQENAWIGIQNTHSDPRTILHVNRLNMKEMPTDATAGWASLFRTTAQSGGVTVTPVKKDRSDSDLPSQVQIARLPHVTLDGTLPWRRVWLNPISLAGLSLRSIGKIKGSTNDLPGTGTLIEPGNSSGVVQALELREGEGIALVISSQSSLPYPTTWCLDVGFRDVTNGRHYDITQYLYFPGGEGHAAFGIFNGSGSGITIGIREISITYSGDTATTTYTSNSPSGRWAIIRHMDGGQSVPLIAASKSKADTTGLDIRMNRMTAPLTVEYAIEGLDGLNDFGYPQTNTALVRRIGAMAHRVFYSGALARAGLAMGMASSAMWNRKAFNGFDNSDFVMGSTQCYEIRRGEGIALLCNNNAGHSALWIEGEVIIETPDTVITMTKAETVYMS